MAGELAWEINHSIGDHSSEKGGVKTIQCASDFIFVWNDFRNGEISNIYAQRVNLSTGSVWEFDRLISSQQYAKFDLVPSINDGVIVIWPNGFDGIFAQQISANGNLGEVYENSSAIASSTGPIEIQTLEQNYPNPFNPTTILKYNLHDSANISLKVYDVGGRYIKTLVTGSHNSGYHEVLWDGTNHSDKLVGAGVYYAVLATGGFSQSIKMVCLR